MGSRVRGESQERLSCHEARDPGHDRPGRRIHYQYFIHRLDRQVGISYVSYGASKAAMNQMTRTTAVEFAPKHIRVNAILPGLMKTPMVEHSAGLAQSYAKGDVEAMWRARDAQVPMGHMGEAWDVANAALFLASDESKYVTGIELVVDGGITSKA